MMSRSRPAYESLECPALVPVQDDSFDQIVAAYQDGEMPTIWTPVHVMIRLVVAFEVLKWSGGAVGPKQYGSAWPAVYHEFADMIDETARKEAERAQNAVRIRPSSKDLSLMNEALAWPLSFLQEKPMQADALLLWAWASADDHNLRELLRTRSKAARAKAEKLMIDENARRKDLRRTIAKKVADWANYRIKRAVQECSPESSALKTRVLRIRENAEIRFGRAVAEVALPIVIKPTEAMPGKVLSRTNLDTQRKAGAAAISAQLNKAKVVVR